MNYPTEYRYIGDRHTSTAFAGQECSAVRRPDGKCIRGRNGSMLVSFYGINVVVIARLLRKIKNRKHGKKRSKKNLSLLQR